MSDMKLGDLFTEEELLQAAKLYQECSKTGTTYNKAVVAEIIEPAIARCTTRVFEKFNASYLGYFLESVFIRYTPAQLADTIKKKEAELRRR